MDERNLGKCQKCACDTPQGGLHTAHCNKIDCDTLPKSTPTPGNGALRKSSAQTWAAVNMNWIYGDTLLLLLRKMCPIFVQSCVLFHAV